MLLQLWEHTPNCRHSFLSEQKGTLRDQHTLALQKSLWRRSFSRTSAGAMSDLLEARLARAEGVGAVGDAVGLVAVATMRPVAPAVVQFGV